MKIHLFRFIIYFIVLFVFVNLFAQKNSSVYSADFKLLNNGFESSTTEASGWWFWSTNQDSDYTHQIVTDEKHNGDKSLKIHVGKKPGLWNENFTAVMQTIPITEYNGKQIKLSAWCKTKNNGKASLQINIIHKNGKRDAPYKEASSKVDCNLWKKIETDWIDIPQDTAKIEPEGNAWGPEADIYFDDFEIITKEQAETEGKPIGWTDSADCEYFQGWSGDPDNPNKPNEVYFYADGLNVLTGKFIGKVVVNGLRESAVCKSLGGVNCEVCDKGEPKDGWNSTPQCLHKYVFPVPSLLKDGKSHAVYTYGSNLPGTDGIDVLLNNNPRTISCSQASFVQAETQPTAPEKYSMRKRFGAGMDVHGPDLLNPSSNPDSAVVRNINEFPWQKLGISWYKDWANGINVEVGGPRNGIEFLAETGSWGKNNAPTLPFTQGKCKQWNDYISGHKDKYPDGAMWGIGNEIGWDDRRTAEEYADEFIRYYDCLKSINPTFKVLSGAIVSFWHNYDHYQGNYSKPGCVDKEDSASGKSYFIKYLSLLKNANKIPDMITVHSYTGCNGGYTFNAFKEQIIEYRKTMKELGLQDKELLITEWGPFYDFGKDYYQRAQYLQETMEYLATAKDTSIGLPNDGYRLVQRWLWFVLNDWKIKHLEQNDRTVALTDTYSGEITPLGYLYSQIVDKYVYGNPEAIDVDRITEIINPDYTVGKIKDGHIKCRKSVSDSSIDDCNKVPKDGIPDDESFKSIAVITSSQKSKRWEIGFQPDMLGSTYIKPEDYAVWFYLFSKEILKYDSNAKIMIGRLTTSVFPELYNKFKESGGNLDSKYVYANDRFNWVIRFREEYKKLYRDYPRVTIWAIDIEPAIRIANLNNNALLNYQKEFRWFLELLPSSYKISERNKPVSFVFKLLNNGFESSTTEASGWWFWSTNQDSDYTHQIVTDEKHNGDKSLKIHVGKKPGLWNENFTAVMQTIPITEYNGKQIKLSAWCKTKNNGKASLQINIIHKNGKRDAPYKEASSKVDCNLWKKIETDWIDIPQDTAKIEPEGNAWGPEADIYFDDFEITVKETGGIAIQACPLNGDRNCDTKFDLSDFEMLKTEYKENKVKLIDFEKWRGEYN